MVQGTGKSATFVELWRGDVLESFHSGDAVLCDAKGDVIWSLGDPAKVILPRSSCKMLQALPLLESGAAHDVGLKSEHLALACASHRGQKIHVDRVTNWLSHLGLAEHDLRCGCQVSGDDSYHDALVRAGKTEDQRFNNCSGKHTGFLTLTQKFKAGPDYIESDHPVQKTILDTFEEMCGETSPGFAIDGCSAPNHSVSLKGLATAMARMADPSGLGKARGAAAEKLRQSMVAHPDLVAADGWSTTDLMRAMNNGTAIKYGAEAVYTVILPERGLGLALKISDGAERAADTAVAALLVRLGVADADHPLVQRWLQPVLRSRVGITSGFIRPAEALYQGGKGI